MQQYRKRGGEATLLKRGASNPIALSVVNLVYSGLPAER